MIQVGRPAIFCLPLGHGIIGRRRAIGRQRPGTVEHVRAVMIRHLRPLRDLETFARYSGVADDSNGLSGRPAPLPTSGRHAD